MLRLDHQLCFLLYSASRQMTAAYRPLLSPLNLTYPQYLVMMVLWEHFGISASSSDAHLQVEGLQLQEGMAVGQLGDRLGLDTGTLTPLLKRLESNGLVLRKRDPQDERIVRIHLTDEGCALQSKAEAMANQLRCSSGLNDAQLSEIREGVKDLLSKLPGFKL